MEHNQEPRGLGVISDDNKVFLYYAISSDDKSFLRLDSSFDGYHFTPMYSGIVVEDSKKRKQNIQNCNNLRISKKGNNYYLTYLSYHLKKPYLNCAVSHDLKIFNRIGRLNNEHETGVIIPDSEQSNTFSLLIGGEELKTVQTSDLRNICKINNLYPQLSNENNFITVGNIISHSKGYFAVYLTSTGNSDFPHYALSALLLNKNEPSQIIWFSTDSLFIPSDAWQNKKTTFIGSVILKGTIMSYWQVEGEGICTVTHGDVNKLLNSREGISAVILKRIKNNPILKPIMSHFWESKAVFNPAAVVDSGKIHLLYRAIGDHDISTIGYASSNNGTDFDERLKLPVFSSKSQSVKNSYLPYSPYASGGGIYGGCEDPRISKIGNKLYMTYVYYDGVNHPRVALTSITVSNFRKKNWDWSDPVIISRPGVVNKNACILPEKVNGKYVIFHRIFPNILIDFVSDLNFDGKTKWLKGEYIIKPRPGSWDSRKVGVGATPIKTSEGWLLIYQAVGNRDPGRYKIGAMILDSNDPTKVLYRSNQPLLSPDESYENEGYKAGVVYPCGAAHFEEKLFVYYGGADTVVCTATANMSQFLSELKEKGNASLSRIKFNKLIN
jgi:predicted GH43/DUF377 family glycosyl hydrolase